MKSEYYMKIALDLAAKGMGTTNPNPMVGAVIVKGGKIVGKGYHKKAGLAHAEVNALRDAGTKARGATMYITMEPCHSYGRTPPCTQAIVNAGIKMIVIGTYDPNPKNHKKGIRFLGNKGIKVKSGVLKKEAVKLNEVYNKFITTGLPWVTVKVAMSLDGKIATRTGSSRWISSVESRKTVMKLRDRIDAILIGNNTCMIDDPYLKKNKKEFIRIVLNSGATIDDSSKIFRSKNVIVAVREGVSDKKVRKIENAGARVICVKSNFKKQVNESKLLNVLAKEGIMHVLVEGGGETIASFVKAGLVDEFYFFIAPILIGGRDAVSPVEGLGIKEINDALNIKDIEVTRTGRDLMVRGYVYRNNN